MGASSNEGRGEIRGEEQPRSSVVFVGEAMVELQSTGPHSATWSFAGDTLNAAAACARAAPGLEVRYLTGVGDDDLSERLLARCRELEVDASESARIAGRRLGLYWIETVDGERDFRYWRDASAARTALSTGVLLPALGDASHLAVSGITLAVAGDAATELLAGLRARRDEGATVWYDLNHRRALWPDDDSARQTHELGLSAADIVRASSDDIAALWAESTSAFIDRAHDAGAREVAVTDGSGPVSCSSPAGFVAIRPRVATVVDTTGAGDAFWGTYLGRRVIGDEVEAALVGAGEIAAQAVEHAGALGYLSPPE